MNLKPKKGGFKNVEEMLKHLSTEVIEATVDYSNKFIKASYNDKPVGLSSELADIVIITALIASAMHIDLNDAVNDKLDWLENGS